MTPQFKSITSVLGIFFDVESDGIMAAKNYLKAEFGSFWATTPHVSLIVLPYACPDFITIEKELSDYFSNYHAFKLSINKLVYEPDNKFYKLEISAPNLFKTHMDLLNLCQKYHQGYLKNKDLIRLSENKFSDPEKEMLFKWGFRFCDKTFDSHMTLGNIKNAQNFKHEEVEQKLISLLGTLPIHINVTHVSASVTVEAEDTTTSPILWKWSQDLSKT